MMDQLAKQIFDTFISFFKLPETTIPLMLIALGIAIIFGAIWLACYLPPLFKQAWLWVIMVASIFSAVVFTAFLQLPLQYLSTQICNEFLSQQNIQTYMLAISVPAMIIAGLVQVGAKLLPVVIFWLLNKKNMDPKTGLMFGAVAGAGFGVIEAFQVHGQAFAMGWTISVIQTGGFFAFLPFIERFFTIGFHTAALALAGYGLAKGKGWQFYLIAAALYTIMNYSMVLMATNIIALIHVEIIILVMAILTATAALWLRWAKPKTLGEMQLTK
ncbi:MAG: hypothetical protein V1904_13830 [Bacteroidota bacterium]